MTEEEQPVNADQEPVTEEAAQPAEEPQEIPAVLQQEQIPLVQLEVSRSDGEHSEIKQESASAAAVSAPREELALEANGNLVEPKAEQPVVPAAEPSGSSAAKEKISFKKIIGIAAVLIIIFIVIFYATRKPAAETTDITGPSVTVSSSIEQGKVNIIEETKNDINVLVSNGDATVYPQVKVTAYLGNTQKNPNSSDCALAYPLDREIDKKYDSNMINTMLGLLQPLSAAEKEQGYVSAIPNGTILKYLKLDDTGVMSVNLSGNISKAAGSCAVTAIKAQIKATISQFAAVKSVVICIDGNCNESQTLQP